MYVWLSSLWMTLIKPHDSWGCLVTLEIATAHPPRVLALPGAWPLEVGSSTAPAPALVPAGAQNATTFCPLFFTARAAVSRSSQVFGAHGTEIPAFVNIEVL